ncbi:MAG: DUF2339 domain-containing protein [Verrucomicrobiales bacterium]
MELVLFALLLLLLLGTPVLAAVAFVQTGALRTLTKQLGSRLAALEAEVRHLRGGQTAARSSDASISAQPATGDPLPSGWKKEVPAPSPEARPASAPAAGPPLLPVVSKMAPLPSGVPVVAEEASTRQSAAPPPLPATRLPSTLSLPAVNWEQFMGAKLFAWIGGLALFLGVAFFVKYSFEHNLISREMRVAIGFLTGLALLTGGVVLKRKAFAVTAQTLCATGVLILYATTYACHGFYHFPFFGLVPTLLLMTLITAVAFVLAVRLNAHVVAVLGMLGGFLTPGLLSTGYDNPFGLFGYIALIDAALLAVALHRRWNYLVPLGGIGTSLLQIGWAARFFVEGQYFEGQKVLIPMAILVGFNLLFLAAAYRAKRRGQMSHEISGTALVLAFIALGFAFFFLTFTPLALRPVLLFGFVFIVDVCVFALVLLDERRAALHPLCGLLVFALLAMWTASHVNDALLGAALALYLVFALFHSAGPLVLDRLRGTAAPWWSQAFPALALGLTLIPLLQTEALPFLVWPFILLVDLLAVLLAVASGAVLPILIVLVLTMLLTGAAISQIPAEMTGLPTVLWMLGVFALFFSAAMFWVVPRLRRRGPEGSMLFAGFPDRLGKFELPEKITALLPACSAVLPFLLLIMVTVRLPIANPSPVFGLALLLVALLLGLTRVLSVGVLPLIGLLSTVALEHAWHGGHFDPASPNGPLAWYVGFYALFTAFPFVFRRAFAGQTMPWAAAALAGPLHFNLILKLTQAVYPNPMMGLLPAVFVLPSLLALIVLLKTVPSASPARNSQLAWFGGVTLFFVTLIFPLQFERQWITIGWALEGVALCWLFHRIPHPGLRLAGVALLIVSFVRLALNPAVLTYDSRSEVAIFNWYLYAYGIVTLCLFAAAGLLAPPRHRVMGSNLPPLLYALGTVLAFILVNIEIADYFTAPGAAVVTLQFSGNLARDMSYSIAWALFALLLVIIGIGKKLAPIRYAGLGLLGVTLLKLFFHDLSELGQLYRIGALVAVAVVAIIASVLYQRFLAAAKPTNDVPSPPAVP